MKKRILTIFCTFLFFSLGLASCCQKKIAKEIKTEEPSTTSSQETVETILEENKTEEIFVNSSNGLEQVETEVKIEEVTPEDLQEISYAFGHLLVQQLNKTAMQFDINYIIQGMEAAVEGKPAPFTEEEYYSNLQRIHDISFKITAANNLVQSEKFLESNKQNKDVIVLLEDKLQYKIIQTGEGEGQVSLDSNPFIHFKGTLLNGDVFVSSKDRSSQPEQVILSQTIPGLSQGILGMKVGEKRVLYIHPELGYGEMEGLLIPPNSVLIFEIEVISISSSQEQEKISNRESSEVNSESLQEEVN